MKVIGRQEAIKQGLLRYFTGKPCLRGHMAERAVSHRGCLQCHADDQFIRQAKNPEHQRAIDKKSRENRPWNSLRHTKSHHSTEEWKRKLEYHSVKSHERRNYSIGTLSIDIRSKLFKLQNGLCNGCACDLVPGFHLDHIVPLVRGGLNVNSNVQLLCPTCNLSKGSKTMQEWKS